MENKQQTTNTSPTPGLESLQQASQGVSSSTSNPSPLPPKRKRPHLTRTKFLVALVILLSLSVATVSALKFNHGQTERNPQDVLQRYESTQTTVVLGSETKDPAQALQGSDTVTINGDLVVKGKLTLSKEAIASLGDLVGSKVNLNPAAGGVAQTGNISVSGTVQAAIFQGNGSNLSGINANNITTGTLSNDRLDSSVTRLGQSIPLNALQANVISSLNNVVNNGGNVDIIGGSGVVITPNATGKTIQIDVASGSGDITDVLAGTGLTGGGSAGSVTLNIDSTVTTQGNNFNGASQLVQLNGSGALPVLDGSLLTNLSATALASGTVADARLTANVTLQGNMFNGGNQLLKLDGSGALPAIDGNALTNLNASALASGTVGNGRLTAAVTLQGNTFNGASQLVQLNGSGALPVLSGVNLTNLNATALSSGTVADARLSGNVPLLNAVSNTFTGTLITDTIQPTTSLAIGQSSKQFTLQGNTSSTITGTSGGFTTTFGFTGTPVANVTYNLDAAAATGTYTICTTIGNCASSGGGVTTLGGSTNKLAKFTGAQSVGDSSITDTGTLVTVGARGLFQAASNSPTAFQIQDQAGTSNLFVANTTTDRIGIGVGTPGYKLDVNGNINSATGLYVGGNQVCDSTGCNAGTGSGYYIQNGVGQQASANFNIKSASASDVVGIVQGTTGQTAALFEARNESGGPVFTIAADGSTTISATPSATALLVQGTSAQDLLRVDANENTVVVGSSNPYAGNGYSLVVETTATAGSGGAIGIHTAAADDLAIAIGYGANVVGASINGDGTAYFSPTDTTAAFQIQGHGGTSNLFIADTTNTRIGIGTATPGYTLDVNGDINIAAGQSYRINGQAICGPAATCAPDSGSTSYIQNGTALQAATNFYIQSANANNVAGVVRGANSQIANLFEARDGSNNTVLSVSPSAVLTLGTQSVYNGQLVLRNTSNANTTTIGAITPTSNQTISLPNESGTLCIQSSTNCGFALTSGSGNYIQNGTSSQTANFNIQSAAAGSVGAIIRGNASQSADLLQLQTGTPTTVFSVGNTGIVTSRNSSDSNAGFRIQNAGGTLDVLRADTTGATKLGVAYGVGVAPGYTLDVNGDINSTTALRIGGASICTSLGCTAAPASAIQNGTTLQPAANFNIESAATGSVTGTLKAIANQTANILEARDGSGNLVTSLGPSGDSVFRTTTNSASAYQIQNSTGNSLVNVNTLSNNLVINSSIDVDTSGWAIDGAGVTIAQTAVQQYNGGYSLGVTTPATANRGAKYALTTTTLASNTTYSFSLYARTLTSSMSTFEIGRAEDGSTETSCLTAQTVLATGWTKYGCTFTTGTTSGTPYIYAKQTDATARTFYVDSVQLIRNNLLANASIESAISGNWTAYGTPTTHAQSATVAYEGTKSLQIVTQATANQGTKQSVTLNDSTTYNITFQAYSTGTAIATMEAGYSSDGSTDTPCMTAQTIPNSIWTTFACTITTPSSHSGTPYFYVKNTAATVRTFYLENFTIPPTNTNNAVQLQNAGTSNLFSVDATNSQVTFNGGFNGEIKPWATNPTTVTGAPAGAGTAILNGYIYSVGGINQGIGYGFYGQFASTNCAIRYAKINANGTIGTWSTATVALTQCPSTTGNTSATVLNGRVYFGLSQTGNIGNFKPDPDGNVTTAVSDFSWLGCLNSRYPSGTQQMFAANGFLYTNGNYDTSYTHMTRMAVSSATGAITGCTDVDLSRGSTTYQSASVVANGYLFTIGSGTQGGCFGAGSVVRSAKINADGTFGTEVTTTSLPRILGNAAAVYSNGYIYVMGGDPNGCGTTTYNSVYYARVNTDGTIGTWNTSANSLPVTRAFTTAQVYNGYIYSIGGVNTSTGGQGTIYYTSTPKVQVNASLDLVGDLSGVSLNDGTGQGGGSITAGKITAIGGLDVYNGSQLNGGAAINGGLTVNGGLSTKNGDVSIASSTNSTTAFQIQNAAASTMFSVDTTNAKISVNNSTNGELNTWASAGTAGASTQGSGTAVSNGYLFTIAGAGVSTVYSQRINSDGTLGTAVSTTAFPSAGLTGIGAFAYNGYIYATGSGTTSIFYAKVNSDGTLGSWTTNATGFTTGGTAQNQIGVANGYFYFFGAGASANSVLYGKIMPDGSIPTVTTSGTTLTAQGRCGSVSFTNGYAIYYGGTTNANACTAGALTTGYVTQLNTSTGDIGAFSALTSLPVGRAGHSAIVSNGFLYILGGTTTNASNASNTVYYNRITSTGTVGATWTLASTTITAARYFFQAQEVNGNIYVPGGSNTSGAGTNTEYYASGARLQLNASLDLIGTGTGSIAGTGNGGGGSIYAGKIFSNSTIEATGQALLNGGASINGDLVVRGNTNIRPITDSTTAILFQNAAGTTSTFDVDTTNGRVGIGTAAPGNLLSVGALVLADSTARLAVGTGATGNKGIIVQGINGQTGDLLQAQDYLGNVLAKIDASGNLTVKNIVATGGITTALSAKTAAYPVTANDSIITCDVSGGTYSITLPTAVGITGREYTVKKIDSSGTTCTVATTSSQTIDGAASYALAAQWNTVTVISNGANWIIKSKF